MRPRRILVPRPADLDCLNAQAQNAQHILAHWDDGDFRPTILTFREPNPRVASNPNVDLLRLPPDRLWPFRLVDIYQRGFDAIFCPGIHRYADWLALRLRALSRRRIPVIGTIEGLAGSNGDDRREQDYAAIAGHPVYCDKCPAADLRRTDAVYTMSDCIIAISPFLARMAAARYGDKVDTLPLGVDDALYRRERLPRGGRPRVLGVGSLIARKRPWIFLDLAAAFPQVDFVWLGDGGLRSKMTEDAAQRGLGNASFPGPARPEAVAEQCALADVFVLPSVSEGVPKVTQEAAATGLPQIVFGFYETPTVVDGRNGFVVWSEAELVARLTQLLGDLALARRMGDEGRQMAEAWGWKDVAQMWRKRIVAALTEDGVGARRM